jgi:predicted enzyme related to lactoylglutathione lyase
MSGPQLATGINQIAISCHDVPRATVFYRDLLGIPFLFASNGIAFLQSGDVRLMLTKPDGEGTGQFNSILYFRTDDIVSSTAYLEAKGVTIVAPPAIVGRLPEREIWVAAFKDSEGNVMAFQQEKPIA